MKINRIVIALLVSLPFAGLQAQNASPGSDKATSTAPRSDIYHVFIAKAAPGKAKEMENWLKTPDPKDPHHNLVVFRHEDGDAWDFVVVQYIGKSATVEVGEPSTMTPQQRALVEWHGDTFVSGPPWAEFAKQMGLNSGGNNSGESVYVVSDYRAVPGQRDELEKSLTSLPPGDTSAGNVVLAHVEGAPWNFLAIVRYDSWEKFVEGEKASLAATRKGEGGWFELRQSCALHHDTIADRVVP